MWAIPDKGQHVVLTHRSQRQVARNDEFVVALVVGKNGQIEGPRSEQLGVAARHPHGGAGKTLRIQ
jgi:hypothetical protein